MANCNKLFREFNEALEVVPSKMHLLEASISNTQKAIIKYFQDEHSEYEPKFYFQGSSVLGTMIRTKEDTCDKDMGVYFSKKPEVEASTLQSWVKKAVENLTETPPMHKNKCIRVIYASQYHIDLPVYYKPDFNNSSISPELAIKDAGYKPSDPKAFADWFTNHINYSAQAIRIIRYLKAWCDHKRAEMPSGLAMSLLTIQNICPHERDDVALIETLKSIKQTLFFSWSCKMPTVPYDDLFENYDGIKKGNFKKNLDALIEDGLKAIEKEKNQLKATNLWAAHLGLYYPEGKDEDIDVKESLLREKISFIETGTAYTDKLGVITNNPNNGTKNPIHTFYGS